jgi:hypothetical protein
MHLIAFSSVIVDKNSTPREPEQDNQEALCEK